MNTSEKISISYKEYPDFLYAFISGEEDDLEISTYIWRTVLGKCQELGFKKLLVEEELKTQVTLLEMYQICDQLVKLALNTGIKIAFVDKEIGDFELNKFGETVAINRGAMGQIFDSFEDAEKWLKE